MFDRSTFLVNQHLNSQWQHHIRKMNEIHKNAIEYEYSNLSSIHWLPTDIIYTKENHGNKIVCEINMPISFYHHFVTQWWVNSHYLIHPCKPLTTNNNSKLSICVKFFVIHIWSEFYILVFTGPCNKIIISFSHSLI